MATDDGAQTRRRQAQEGSVEGVDLQHRGERISDPPVDEEVDGDRRVVAGDRRLGRDFHDGGAQVDLERSIDERDDKGEPRAFDQGVVRPTETEDDEPLILGNDLDGQNEQDGNDNEQRQGEFDHGDPR